jgi:hypothetical protein
MHFLTWSGGIRGTTAFAAAISSFTEIAITLLRSWFHLSKVNAKTA